MKRNRTFLMVASVLLILAFAIGACAKATEEPTSEVVAPQEPTAEVAAPEATEPPTGPTVSDYSGDLVISVWGGTTEEFIREFAEPKFKEIYPNVNVIYDVGGMSARYNKLLAQKESPEVDIFISTSEALISAINEGLVVPINKDNIPNMENLYDWALPASEYGAAYAAIAYGLGYNPDFFGDNPPDSWDDLWRPEVQGKIAVPAVGHSMMIDFIIAAAELNGGSMDNPQPGFDALAQLDPVAQTFFYTDWNALFNAGDVVLATDFDYYINSMADTGSNIVYVTPKEGGFGSLQHAAVVKGTANQEAVEIFINILLEPDVQQAVGESLLNAPARTDTVLSPELADSLACYGESLNQINWLDPEFAAAHRAEWTELMNEFVSPEWGK